jgi:iron complex transport system substrate-binding protein
VAAKSKPKVGQFLPATISLETIVSLKPDVVLTDTGVQGPLIASLERLSIATVAIEAKSWTQVRAGITTIGELAGVPDRAKELNDGITKRAEAIRERVRTRPRVRVFFLINEQPLMTVGPKTFLSESLTMAGGINVFEDAGQDYPTVSDEELIRRAPEVILVSRSGETAAKRQELLARSSWRNLPAVRSGRIVFVDEDLVSRAGPRLAEGLDAIAAAIHGP